MSPGSDQQDFSLRLSLLNNCVFGFSISYNSIDQSLFLFPFLGSFSGMSCLCLYFEVFSSGTSKVSSLKVFGPF